MVTVTVTVILVATVAFFLLTPTIIDLYTVTNRHADVHEQQQVAIFLLRWFVPQLACYGLIALFTALLNTRGKFATPMFVPIANNLVVIVVLGLVPRDRAPSEFGVDRRKSPGAGPPRVRDHPRRLRAGRLADPFAAPCRPPPPIPLGPGP